MSCEVCGAECGTYQLCYTCNQKRANWEIYKCTCCGKWHITGEKCTAYVANQSDDTFLYRLRERLLTQNEQNYYKAILSVLPTGYRVFPQINLAAIIEKSQTSKYRNELFRNLDFLITDAEYHPRIAIEINDSTHLNADRRERDQRVKNICEEAGISLFSLWSNQGVNTEYIQRRIFDILQSPPPVRVHHYVLSGEPSEQASEDDNTQCVSYTPYPTHQRKTFHFRLPRLRIKLPRLRIRLPRLRLFRKRKRYKRYRRRHKGCYIATCVYGSYDCPAVWTLRRFRDSKLEKSIPGRAFIRIYYAISPTLVKLFGSQRWFCTHWKKRLDGFVAYLNHKGVPNTPYKD